MLHRSINHLIPSSAPEGLLHVLPQIWIDAREKFKFLESQ
jgi:hypothetical protein